MKINRADAEISVSTDNKTSWKALRENLLADPEVKKEYDALEPEYQLINAIIQMRVAENLTQTQLAERIGTTQKYICRLEAGKANPTLNSLKKMADGMGKKLHITFE